VLNVDFVVYGVVLEEDEEQFLEEFMNNQSRIKEQIVLTMHSAETNDLSSAGLGLIKRRILEKTNRILGRPLLHEIVFTKINFVER
jgi:flagellar basal body-associated protein FliL